jgi:thiosulfate dehydrogenase
MNRYLRHTVLVLMLGAVGSAQATHSVSPNPEDWYIGTDGVLQYVAPDEAAIPNDATGAMIRYGKQILEETYKMLGPESGLANSYVTSRLSCTNCHIESGRAAYGQPWAVVWYKYGAGGQGPWSARSNQFLDMKNRIHDCTQRSMNGFRLPNDSYELLSMIEYMKWLSTGIKVADWTKVTHGSNNVSVSELSPPRPADPVRGKTVFDENCAACHGVDGEGLWDANAKKYIYPAVWGQYSFNNGAGMYRLRTAVGFIKGNMPFGWANPTDTTHQLTTEDAWDSMAYVISNYRPEFSGALQDWLYYRPSDCAPNWLLKVTQLDAGYESYYPRIKPDGTLTGDLSYPSKYSPERHKYGPWRTPNDMLAEMTAIQTAYLAKTPRPVFPNCEPFEYTP